MNAYGYCSTSVATEFINQEIQGIIVPGDGYGGIERRDGSYLGGVVDLDVDVQPRNQLDSNEKLHMALDMAEGIADLHGFEDGVIVHGDIQPCQWLKRSAISENDRATLVLGDFTRANIIKWNENTREYCKYYNGEAFSDYRAPEEYNGQKVDEKIVFLVLVITCTHYERGCGRL